MKTSIGKKPANKKRNTKEIKKQKKKTIKLKVSKTHKPEDRVGRVATDSQETVCRTAEI